VYLFDTNIFLEVMLSQEKSDACKSALIEHSDSMQPGGRERPYDYHHG
jgi:hypothetical protein